MGALSVAIYDYATQTTLDVSPRVLGVSIADKIDDISTFSASIKHLERTHALDDIAITYNGQTLFVGIIEEQADELIGGSPLVRFSEWKGSDFALKMQNRLVNRIYENQTIEAIIADLFTRYPCGITTNNVRPTYKTVESIDFPYVPLIECVNQLAEIAGWRWYVDTDGDLHFFDTDEGLDPSITFTTVGPTRNIRKDSIKLNTQINDRTANRVWVIGARQASPNYVNQYWTGDGQNNLFSLSYTPNYPEVKENGDSKTIELDKGTGSSKDYVYDKKNKVLRRVAGPLPAGVSLHLRYRPTTQIIDYFEDSASIATYGIYEKAIKDKRIVERMAARARGRAELKRRSDAVQTLSFETRELGVQRGRRYRVVIPELQIDREFLCTGVTTKISAPDTVNISKTVEMEAVV